MRAILKSVREEHLREDGLQRWKAFGMDMLVSNGLVLTECGVEPARAVMRFSDLRGGAEETFERYGMVSNWLNVSVDEWRSGTKPNNLKVRDKETKTTAGHEMSLSSGQRSPGWLASLIGRTSQHESAAWICPNDGRLYCVRITGPLKGRAFVFTEGRLSCCDGLGLSTI